MSPSPTTPAPAQLPGRPELLALLWSVPDPRDRRGVRHQLPVILAVGLAAVLTGARSFAAIGEWVVLMAGQSGTALIRLGVGDGGSARRPTESTIRRAFARVDADLLDRVIGAFVWTRTHVVAGRRVIALDGKTVRGGAYGERGRPAPGRRVRPRHRDRRGTGRGRQEQRDPQLPARYETCSPVST